MRLISKTEIVEALKALGICPGDIVHVQSDLRSIGPVDAPLTREGQCGFYIEALHQVIGSEGTITCCTAFEDYGRFGTPFVREESPSRTDMLSEYIRTRSDSVRSMHPIVSVTGLGRRAEELCSGHHFSGFGFNSPWGRLHRSNAKILTLGISSSVEGGMTFLHYVEAMYGVPYQYIKLYKTPVISGGRPVPGNFVMHARYLDYGIVNAVYDIKARFLADGHARQARTGRAISYCVAAGAAFAQMTSYLDENIWTYLKDPPNFRQGEIPVDGPVGEMKKSYDNGR